MYLSCKPRLPASSSDVSRKQASSKHEKLGRSTRGIKGRRKKRGETTTSLLFSPSLPPLRAHHLCNEREVWERGSLVAILSELLPR